MVGKITAGYQGWFTCEGDNSPVGGWWHWAPDRLSNVCAKNCGFISWPDMKYYQTQFQTAYAPYPDGTPSRLFSNYNEQTVHAHFEMMRDGGVDTAALQRFNPCGGEGPIRDAITPFVQRAAEATGRKWYCMYDVSGWGKDMPWEIKNDWTTKMSAYVSKPGYAFQNGKPVVCIWGFGFNDDSHANTVEECLDVIRWFKDAAGCYVIGGVPTRWREGGRDSRPGYESVYHAFNMLSPWMIGRVGKIRDLDNMYREANVPDQEDCEKHGVDYQPCVQPGDLSLGQRLHGDFYWRHFYNTCRLKCAGVYISMFDEYNEGNQIAPTAESRDHQPADFKHVALDEDGVPCTSDYYLRLTRDAGAMFKGQAPLTSKRHTEPWPGKGPVNWHPKRQDIGLRARVNWKLVCAENGGKEPLVSDRDNKGPWESFTIETVEQLSDEPDAPVRSKVRIKACNGRYLTPDMNADKKGLLVATVENPTDAETFEMQESDAVVLKASNGMYVQASDSGSGPLVAWAAEAGWWESFEIVE